MNTELKKKAKNDLEKDLSKPMNNAFLKNLLEIWESIKNRNQARKNCLVSEPQTYDTNIFLFKKFISCRNAKHYRYIMMPKPVYLDLSVLQLSKIVIYESWYFYLKLKYGKKAKFCYMDKENFMVYMKTEEIYADIAEDTEERFNT